MKPKISLIIGIICISFSPIFVKLAVAAPITSAFYRLAIAWLLLLPYCIFTNKLKINNKALAVALASGIVFGADMAVWNLSLVKISATVSTLVANLAPVWVGLFSFLLWRQKSGILFWVGTLVAIIGMVVLVGYQHIMHLEFSTGILYAIAASLLYAIYILISKGILKQVSITTFMFYSMLSASAFLFIACKFEGNELVHFPASTWLYFIGMGLICQLTGWVTINYSLSYLESTKVSIALLGQTVLAGLLAVVLLNEILDFNEIAGSLIVLLGIAITFLKRRQLNNS